MLLCLQHAAHGIHLGLRLLPLLLLHTILQQTATRIEPIAVLENLHATEGNEEMRLGIDSEGTHKTAIVGTLAVLVGKDEAESLSLGQSA